MNFRGGKKAADKILPISACDTTDPGMFWRWMADYEKETGGKLLVFSHTVTSRTV